jgi:gamma-glutamylcyclotransferase
MRTLYFAYGSNMDEGEIREHSPSSRYLGPACLKAYRLAFTRRSVRSGTGVADVLPAAGYEVWGALYELDEEDLDALDRKEGRGWAYARDRKRVRLSTDCSERDAIVYTVVSKEPAEVPPSREYLDRLTAAAGRRALPRAYVAMLERTGSSPGRTTRAESDDSRERTASAEGGPAGSSAG